VATTAFGPGSGEERRGEASEGENGGVDRSGGGFEGLLLILSPPPCSVGASPCRRVTGARALGQEDDDT
jgi:hypothetical protein